MRANQVPALSQGLFYVATGLWPILHIRSFEAVTGPKVDRWLAKTMGGLIAAVGTTLIVGALAPRPTRLTKWLGIGTAVALGAADLIYSLRGRISKAYLADAAAEGAIVASWATLN
jgi:hypothetical protein